MLKFSDIENWTIVRGPGEAERAAGVVGLVGAKADGTMVLPDGSSPVSGGGALGRDFGIRIFDGRIAATHTPDATSGTTYQATFTLKEVPDAVELILANGSATPYSITAMSALAVNPDGSDINGASSGLSAASVVGADTVPALVNAGTPGVLLCNRILLSNPNAYKMVTCRVHVAAGTPQITMMGNGASGANDAYTNWASRTGDIHAFRAQTGNQTATAGAFTATTPVSFSPIIGVRYTARGKVVTIMTCGDSIDSGRGTYKYDNPIRQAVNQITRTGYAVEIANVAWAGSSTANNREQLATYCAAGIIPDYVVRSIGSPNDTGGAISDGTTVSGWRQALGVAKHAAAKYGVKIIWRTVIPANNTGDTPAGLETWGATDSLRISWNNEALSWRDRGQPVIDWSAAVSGDTGVAGNVMITSGLTTDGTHPNDAGNAVLATASIAAGVLP